MINNIPFPQGHTQATVVPLKFDQAYHYPVCFTRDVFSITNPVLINTLAVKNQAQPRKIMVMIDDGVTRRNPQLLNDISLWFEHHRDRVCLAWEPVVFPGGEQVKNAWDHVHRATKAMDDSGIDRHGVVIALGGGALLDMVGFSASMFHRGIQLVRLPTTTLAQNDAGIGVKNGINQYGKKNCLGTFYLPVAVINDYRFLETLPFDHFIGGVAEAFKIALIRDRSFFLFLEKNSALLKQRDPKAIEETIERCARLHIEHIAHSGDAFETGSSRPLDYGHWSAHKLEMLSGFAMGHGQAVSIGIALDSYYACQQSLIARAELDRIITALINCGLPVWSPYLETTDSSGHLEIENGLEEFRLHLGGRLTFTMPDGIGQKCERHAMDFDIIRQGVAFLKNTYSDAGSNRPITRAVTQR
ncbi:AroB2 [Desulforapulum autotrophicum HRM2]|uniref:AroB2 n=1 Tax=Desulforapulum autotrophicum (strain ATCC 43914 / DSM 3382 / VKM B-1955 / HRM2) TaxID=177437 RepID=C0Q9K1_DESAH|nr:3-dehydroquinate synthase [Desulforapulum autotrophicum]ACN14565.1 AroB2 [Desulforapulum autotrophicum HRM2]